MENKLKSIRIFLASPGDVGDERDIVKDVIEDLQLMIGKSENLHLELIKWETHAYPDIGEYSQGVINDQIGEFSILIGVMWQRFGTKTKYASSGTEEEFNNAFSLYLKHGQPKIMFYFKDSQTIRGKSELKQLEKVFDFKEKLGEHGTLYWEYQTAKEFERKLRVHLYHHLMKLAKEKRDPIEAVTDTNTLDVLEKNRKSKIFLSYKSHDQQIVEHIYKEFIDAGLSPWMSSYDIEVGEKWKDAIEKSIKESDIFITFISKNINNVSETGFGRNDELSIVENINEIFSHESNIAHNLSREIKIVPVLLDDSDIPLELNSIQYFDLRDRSNLPNLIDKIKLIINKRIN